MASAGRLTPTYAKASVGWPALSGGEGARPTSGKMRSLICEIICELV